jgi:hypothetical protein
MDYDTRDILPDEYRNREERPKRRRDFDRSSDNGEKKRNDAERRGRKVDRRANGEERNLHQWRDDLQTAPCSTARR